MRLTTVKMGMEVTVVSESVGIVAGGGPPQALLSSRPPGELIGQRLGRLTVATIVPYDCGRESERSAAGGYELDVIGTRGAGISNSILGRPAGEMAPGGRIAVLLVGRRE